MRRPAVDYTGVWIPAPGPDRQSLSTVADVVVSHARVYAVRQHHCIPSDRRIDTCLDGGSITGAVLLDVLGAGRDRPREDQ